MRSSLRSLPLLPRPLSRMTTARAGFDAVSVAGPRRSARPRVIALAGLLACALAAGGAPSAAAASPWVAMAQAGAGAAADAGAGGALGDGAQNDETGAVTDDPGLADDPGLTDDPGMPDTPDPEAALPDPDLPSIDIPTDDTVGLIEAPATARSTPSGSFSLVPERNERRAARAPRLRNGPEGAPPVVVELFTAQGCSSCPAADALIAALADQPGVLTLSWHVDYWDYLGWPDAFALPQNTRRQQGYARVAGERGVYTPQIIVDGQDTLISVERGALLALIDDHAARPSAVMVTATDVAGGHAIDLTPRAAIPGGVEVLLVRFLPARETEVTAGENAGREILYRNIVVGTERLASWNARAPLRLTVREGQEGGGQGAAYPGDTRHAILVQQMMRGGRPGPILAAIRLD